MSEKILEILVFVLGGSAYGLMEVLFRGHTHWTMVITGGACILTLYLLSGWLMSIPLILAAASGALIVTAYEFCVGMIVSYQFSTPAGASVVLVNLCAFAIFFVIQKIREHI